MLLTIFVFFSCSLYYSQQICQSIIVSGERLARQERSRAPLMYMWHEKHYVGAAHGIVGIIYMLLQVKLILL